MKTENVQRPTLNVQRLKSEIRCAAAAASAIETLDVGRWTLDVLSLLPR